MSWLEQYRTASFRNVNFYVTQHEATGGRRTATHEFPNNDESYTQDMGLTTRQYTVDAYVIGDNYFAQRNKLLDALESGGAGSLVHPYLGSRNVMCSEYRLRESVAEGRIARFTISFINAGEIIYPEEVVDSSASILDAREAALLAINNWFLATYQIARKPWAVVQNARDTIGVGVTAVNDAKKLVQTVPEFKAAVGDAIDDVVNLSRDATELAITTTQLLSFGTLATDIFEATAENARWQFEGLKELFDFQPVVNKGEDDPATVYAYLISFSAVVVASGLTAVMEYDSFEDSKVIINKMIEQIDSILTIENLDDNIAVTLKDLQKIIVESIDLKGVDLSRLSVIVLTQAQPALVLSHALYGSIDQEQDILTRNKIGQPGFVPGGVPIEVLLSA
jgi:prophage DNA circulation protein